MNTSSHTPTAAERREVPVNIAVRLREGTRATHTQAEKTAFMGALLKGNVDADTYRRMLLALHTIYAAMEQAMERHREHPAVAPLFFPALWRRERLARDLACLCRPGGTTRIPRSLAAAQYAARIRDISDRQPALLAAHAYTRYLGDLSGGQILKRVVRLELDLPPDEGTAFYDFPQITDTVAFKDQYRRALNAIPLDEVSCQDLVEEANLAFQLNIRLFDELGAAVPACRWMRMR